MLSVERLDDGVTLVSVEEPLGYHETLELEEALAGALLAGTRRLAVDLSHAAPVDETAVGVLFRALRDVRAGGGAMALAVPDDELREALGTMGLDRLFVVAEDRPSALAALRAAGAGGVSEQPRW